MLTNLTAREMAPRRGAETTMPFGPRRCMFINAAERMAEEGEPLEEAALDDCETLDLFYRTLCAVMYKYAPLSGHPGGSISCGRFVALGSGSGAMVMKKRAWGVDVRGEARAGFVRHSNVSDFRFLEPGKSGKSEVARNAKAMADSAKVKVFEEKLAKRHGWR